MAVALEPGQLFAGDFRIERRLGEGGMGSVYVVTQLSTAATRALKLMHVDLSLDPSLRRRFEQEARIGAGIRSDHVVQVVAAGVDEATRTPWLAMELLDGETLAQLAARRGPLEPALVAELYLQLCHALAAAHAASIVHRDLKPDNIFIARPQRPGVPFTVKVLDFGIAKMVAEASTKTTEPLGTPLWMSPEQTQHDAQLTPAADVWALGLIAFFLLTGRLYWRGVGEGATPAMLLRQIIIDPLPSASDRARELGVLHLLPAGFDAWFSRAAARDPAARFRDAGEAHAALAPILGGSPAGLALAATAPALSAAASATPSTSDHISVRPPAPRAPTPFELNTTMAPSMAASGVLASGGAADRPKRSAAPYVIAAIGVVAIAGGGTALFLSRGTADASSRAATSSAPSSPPPEGSAVARASATPSSPLKSPGQATPPDRPVLTPVRPATSTSSSAKPLPPFNEMSARSQVELTQNTAWICLKPGDPPTSVAGSVTFTGATGHVKSADVQGPGFGVQPCVKGQLMVVSVPPFDGPDRVIAFSYVLKPH